MKHTKKLGDFLKQEAILIISALLALLSTIAVPPDRRYLSYLPAAAGLDFDTAECAVRAVLIVAAAEYAAADGLATHLTLAHFHCSLHWFYH